MAVGAATSASQSILQQLQLQQAQRNADQAAQNARTLQAQASDAQRVADRAQDKARTLKVAANQAQTIAGQAAMGLQATRSWGQAKVQLSNTYTQVAQAQQTAPKAQPVLNAQGQVTGSKVNVTA